MRKRTTKLQRRVNASRKSKQKRMSTALRKFLATYKPSMLKGEGAAVKKNPGGSITIIKVPKVSNSARRRRR